jgi:hypothetical protein
MKSLLSLLLEEFNPLDGQELSLVSLTWRETPRRCNVSLLLINTLVATSLLSRLCLKEEISSVLMDAWDAPRLVNYPFALL